MLLPAPETESPLEPRPLGADSRILEHDRPGTGRARGSCRSVGCVQQQPQPPSGRDTDTVPNNVPSARRKQPVGAVAGGVEDRSGLEVTSPLVSATAP
jgi:hypothetical protein